MITFLYPALMLPAALLAVVAWRRRERRTIWRTAALVLFVLLAGYPMVQRASRSLRLVAVVDRSRSMSGDATTRASEVLDLVRAELAPGDTLAVVSFASQPHLEAILEHGQDFREFGIPYHPDASDLAGAVRLAVELAPRGASARLLVLSDGEFTGTDPRFAATLAAERGVPIDVRHLGARTFFDLAAVDAAAPPKVLAREPFTLTFEVSATMPAPGAWRVLRDGRPLRAGSGPEGEEGWRPAAFRAGRNVLTVADLAALPGTHRYTIEVRADPPHEESVLENNVADHYVRVVGEERVLVVNSTGTPDNVARTLSAAGIPTGVTSIGSYGFELVYLQGYKAVVLADVPIHGLQYRQMSALGNFVLQEGGGLLVTGGKSSFQGGGYYKSPLDPLLPVSMEIEQRRRMVSTAIVYVLDRSGSMTLRVSSGESKMDLANRGVVESMKLLQPNDEVGVIAVDSQAHTMVPLSTFGDGGAIMQDVLRIESMGGGIFVYTGLAAAGRMIADAQSLNKHIILFSDAMDSEEPGNYRRLLADFRSAGISVHVIGLGTDKDVDAEFLRDIARRGEGEVFFTDDAQVLPQLFAMNTMNLTRSAFVTDVASPWEVRPAARMLASGHAWRDFEATDFNLLYARPEANVALVSADEDQAPGLAFWQRGAGRVVALAFDPSGSFAGQPHAAELLLDATRWAMGSDVADSFAVSVRRDGAVARVVLELSDEERRAFGGASVDVFSPDGRTERRPLRWAGRNELEADIALDQVGAYRGMVRLGDQLIRMDPVALPASPEFRHDRDAGDGRRTLLDLARLTGGRELLDVRTIFDQRTAAPVKRPFVLPLLVALLALLVLDVAEERFRLERALKTRGRQVAAWWGTTWGRVRHRARAVARETFAAARDATPGTAGDAGRGGEPGTADEAGGLGAAPVARRRRPKATGQQTKGAAASGDARGEGGAPDVTTSAARTAGGAARKEPEGEGLGYLRDLKRRRR